MVVKKQARAVILNQMNKITGKPKIAFKLNPHDGSKIWDRIQFFRDRTAVEARVLRKKPTEFKRTSSISRFIANSPARTHIENARTTERSVRESLIQGAKSDPSTRQSYYIKGDDPKKARPVRRD